MQGSLVSEATTRCLFKHLQLAKPLHHLTERGAAFRWRSECQGAFGVFRQLVTSTTVLAYANFSRQLNLDTDVSGIRIGSVYSPTWIMDTMCASLWKSNIHDTRVLVLHDTSRVTGSVSFTGQFCSYLLVHHFLLRTEHRSLTWLCRMLNLLCVYICYGVY